MLTVHGFGLAASAVQRLAPDVPLWNTENWYTAFSDRTTQQFLFERARGAQKVDQVILGNFFSAGYRSGGYYTPKQDDIPDIVPQPNAAAYSAMVHFLEGTDFSAELAPEKLPYEFLFTRRDASTPDANHRAVLVLFGQNLEPDESNWPQTRAGEGATARLPALSGITGVFNRFGNPIVAARDGSRTIPFNTEAVYAAADNPDALRRVSAALQPLRYERPLHLGVLDPSAPLASQPTLTVRVSNPMPQAMPFLLQIGAPDGWELQPARLEAIIAAGATTDYAVKIVRAVPLSSDGRSTFNFDFTTPLSKWRITEPIETRSITRRTPPPSATAAQWQRAGIIPVVLREAGAGQNDQALAAMPWERLANTPQADSYGRYALAYDDRFLYLMADIKSEKRGDLPFDQTRDDWYELHPGGYAYKRAPEWPFRGENVQLAINCMENEADYLYPKTDARHRRYPMREVDYLFGFYQTRQGAPQVWLYKRPGSPFRHRYPFSPVVALDQTIAPGAKLHVSRDEASQITHFEAALPLDLMPEVAARRGAMLGGLEVKLTPNGQNGLYSSAGRGAAKREQSAFQPYWVAGSSVEIPWGFAQ